MLCLTSNKWRYLLNSIRHKHVSSRDLNMSHKSNVIFLYLKIPTNSMIHLTYDFDLFGD